MHTDDLFTAPQVAKICCTDLKTIHNWVNRGEIQSFRTPGRHLRFRRADVIAFLDKFGYPVPEGFAPLRKRVVILDSAEVSLSALKRNLGRDFDVDCFADTIDALLHIGQNQPNIVLINADAVPDAMHIVSRLAASAQVPVAVFAETEELASSAQSAGAVDFILTADGKDIRRRVTSLLIH
ncbi:MAG: helix-turn-helix domain-containing protein [Myxococcota bacterium]|jgi:excisionase family DNA binding protein|nr:helix-turn-helix domain-containing protein [Myxococcota bacterium]